MRRFALAAALTVGLVACTSSRSEPIEFESGLTVGYLPAGFEWVWNTGNETATYHVFQTADQSEEVSVGVQMSPAPTLGETITRDGREFIVYDEGTQIRVSEDVGNNTRVDVVSASLDKEALLQIAESISYQPSGG